MFRALRSASRIASEGAGIGARMECLLALAVDQATAELQGEMARLRAWMLHPDFGDLIAHIEEIHARWREGDEPYEEELPALFLLKDRTLRVKNLLLAGLEPPRLDFAEGVLTIHELIDWEQDEEQGSRRLGRYYETVRLLTPRLHARAAVRLGLNLEAAANLRRAVIGSIGDFHHLGGTIPEPLRPQLLAIERRLSRALDLTLSGEDWTEAVPVLPALRAA